MPRDSIIERSPAQKRLRLEIMRLELTHLGYSIIRTERLKQMIKRLPAVDQVEAMMEAVR